MRSAFVADIDLIYICSIYLSTVSIQVLAFLVPSAQVSQPSVDAAGTRTLSGRLDEQLLRTRAEHWEIEKTVALVTCT